jgi:hypothetical protein
MAYSTLEQRYLDNLIAVQYPDPPPEAAPAQDTSQMPLGTGPNDIQTAEVGSRNLPERAYTGRNPDSIKGIDPTKFEKALEATGLTLEQAGRFLHGLGTVNVPLLGDVSLADFVPFVGTAKPGSQSVLTPAEWQGTPMALQQAGTGQSLTTGTGFARRMTEDAGLAAMDVLVNAVPVGKAIVKGGKALAPKAAEVMLNTMEDFGTPIRMGAVPLERFSSVSVGTAKKVDQGKVKISDKVSPGQVLQLAPEYRVKVTGAYTPEGKKQNIQNAVNPSNYEEAATRLDSLSQAFPDPLESPERFSAMLATVYNSNEVPIPPRWMIENANDMPKWSNWFAQMTQGQLDEANRGFSVVDKFKQIYTDGTASPETTGRLMMWAMLSRRASAYPHESGFLDLAESMTPLIQKALRGEYGQAEIDAGLQMIKQSIPAGSPGNMVTSNANDFLRTFLPKMSEKLPDGRSKLQALHEMIADPNMTGPQIRRAFYGLAENVGIKNKVLSFALLVSGREDVMVLDRIQINRLFAGGEKIYDDVAHLFDGGPGLAIYEGLERSLGSRVKELYANVGRPDQASLGRYHWESWVLSSGQEVAHPTLETIVKSAQGEANAFANVPVKEGRMHERAFGVSYERTADGGNKFVFPTVKNGNYEFTKPGLDALFEQVMDKKNGIIPADFPGVKYFSKDTLQDGTTNPYFGKPWYSWPGVDRGRIDELAATFGTKINSPSGVGLMETIGADQAANRPVGTRATATKRTSVNRGKSAPLPGAE